MKDKLEEAIKDIERTEDAYFGYGCNDDWTLTRKIEAVAAAIKLLLKAELERQDG